MGKDLWNKGGSLWKRGLAAMAAVSLLTACGDSDGKDGIADGPEEKVSKEIEALTGDHSRLAWTRYLGKSADVFANYNQQQLWGIDSRDGLGVRAILEDKGNYSRPLISPDGEWIVYTDKNTKKKGNKKAFKPEVYRVDWQGEKVEKLGKGFAVDLWRDPETDKTWVYVANLVPTSRASMFADKLERFLLDDPEKRELVWNKTEISIDSIQLSRDGKRASCLFPWPDVGVIDLENKEYWKNQHGCWPSLAPDNSYVAWVFDGSHKTLHLFADRGKKLGVVPINDGPGMGGHEMYHPRWSNDARFLTVTGPYKGPSIGKSGKHAEVYIGKFGKKLKAIEDWVRVTDDNKGDHFPDLWVKGGEKVSLGKIGGGAAATPVSGDKVAKSWPSAPGGLLFLWENGGAQTPNQVGGAQRVCRVEARGRARFGRHFEMLCGGGHFEADPASVEAIANQTAQDDLGFQLLLTAKQAQQAGSILSFQDFQLRQGPSGELWLSTEGGDFSLGKVKEGVPLHLAASRQGGKWALYLDGNPLEREGVEGAGAAIPPAAGVGVGDGKWEGSGEALAIYGRALEAGEVAADAANLAAKVEGREPAGTIKLRGKLVEMTAPHPVEDLDTYRRALLVYTYEVEEVIEGKYDQPKVLVNHWSILDRKPLASIPRQLGKSYTLEIEALKEHPELTSERRWSDSFEALDEYFDITTPEP